MHPTLHLFYLIRNLDTAEVKYFRAFAKRKVKSGTSSALALFDLVFANEVYDDEAFEKAVAVGNFPALKVYLYEMIAEAMLEREMKRKGLTEIFALSQQAEMFQRKGLMDGMWRKMEKAMLLCERYEEFAVWRDLLRKKQSILMRDAGEGIIPEGMEDFDTVYPFVKERARILENYRDLEDQIEAAKRIGGVATFEAASLLKDNPLLALDAARHSVKAELRFGYIKRHVIRWTGEYTETATYSEKIIQGIETNPFVLLDTEFQHLYLGSLHHLGMFEAASKNFEKAARILDKLRSLENSIQGISAQVFERLHSLELQLSFIQGDNERGLEIISTITDGLKLHEFQVKEERRISYYYQIAHFHLYFSQPDLALKWILKLRECNNPRTKKDLQDFGEVMYLICHFDLGNYNFIIRTEAEKALNRLSKRSALSVYEEAIIKGLRKAAKADSAKNRNRRLCKIGDKLKEISLTPKFKHKDSYFPFGFWLAAHLEGNTPNFHLLQAENQFS
jgi:tetratricopeptide (TPR) repeat protein